MSNALTLTYLLWTFIVAQEKLEQDEHPEKLAYGYLLKCDLAKAETHFKIAIRRYVKEGNSGSLESVLSALGVVQIQREKYEDAETNLLLALNVRSLRKGDPVGLAGSIEFNLGSLYLHLGRFKEAEDQYHICYAVRRKNVEGPLDESLHLTYSQLGRLYCETGHAKAAVTCLSLSVEILSREDPKGRDVSRERLELAEALILNKERDKAIAELRLAGESDELDSSYLAYLWALTGDARRARKLLARDDKKKHVRTRAREQQTLAVVEAIEGDKAKAYQHLQEAVRLAKSFMKEDDIRVAQMMLVAGHFLSPVDRRQVEKMAAVLLKSQEAQQPVGPKGHLGR